MHKIHLQLLSFVYRYVIKHQLIITRVLTIEYNTPVQCKPDINLATHPYYLPNTSKQDLRYDLCEEKMRHFITRGNKVQVNEDDIDYDIIHLESSTNTSIHDLQTDNRFLFMRLDSL